MNGARNKQSKAADELELKLAGAVHELGQKQHKTGTEATDLKPRLAGAPKSLHRLWAGRAGRGQVEVSSLVQAARLLPGGSAPHTGLMGGSQRGWGSSVRPSVRPCAGRDVGQSELPAARHSPKSPRSCCPCKPCCLLGMGRPLASSSPALCTHNRRGRRNGDGTPETSHFSPGERQDLAENSCTLCSSSSSTDQ